MTAPFRQLVLDLPVSGRFEAEDFLVGPSNEAAHDLVAAWPDWPDPVLFLRGPAGSGKSHFAAIWAKLSGAQRLAAAAVTPGTAAALAGLPALAIEDVDRGIGEEAALFHLLNRLREAGACVLLTARATPDGCGIRTPDLLSRLRRAPQAVIEAPDDGLLRAGLVKLFLDRQLLVDTTVIEYLASRIERSFASATEVVAELDRAALSLGRRVTRAVAAEVVARRSGSCDCEP